MPDNLTPEQKAEAFDRLAKIAPALIKAVNLGFEFSDGDVFGMHHNETVDALAELETIFPAR